MKAGIFELGGIGISKQRGTIPEIKKGRWEGDVKGDLSAVNEPFC
jgi:hypothetical protein